MSFFKTAALLCAVIAVPAAAQTAAPAAEAAPKPRKICRAVDTTGSIMVGTKVCHTKDEWAKIDDRNGSNVQASRDIRGGGGSPRGN